MAILDVRQESKVDVIQFTDSKSLRRQPRHFDNHQPNRFFISDSEEDLEMDLEIHEIDALIKALEAAKIHFCA